MPKFRVVEKWTYRVTFLVEAESAEAAEAGDVKGSYDEVARDDGEYVDTLEVEEVAE